MTLSETINFIKLNFKQTYIPISQYDYELNSFFPKLNPKYLFRGEFIYPSTKSSYHRLIETNPPYLQELNHYTIDLAIFLLKLFHPKLVSNSLEYKYARNEVGGYLQHYGFPIMNLDFTKNIDVAAFFASYKNNLLEGQICVVETEALISNNYEIIKLCNSRAKRPILQEAYSIRMYNDKPDLKEADSLNSKWFRFTLTESDKLQFENKQLLSTSDDIISEIIIKYIQDNKPKDKLLAEKLNEIKHELHAKKNWV